MPREDKKKVKVIIDQLLWTCLHDISACYPMINFHWKATNSWQKCRLSLTDRKLVCLLSNKLKNTPITVTNTLAWAYTRAKENQRMNALLSHTNSEECCYSEVVWLEHSFSHRLFCASTGKFSTYLLLSCMVFWQPSLHYDRCQFLLLFRIWVVVWKSSVLWDIMPCNLLKVNRRFGRTCSHQLQDWRISPARTSQARLLPASYWFLFRPWRWRRHVPPKSQLNFNGLYGVVTHNIELFLVLSSACISSFLGFPKEFSKSSSHLKLGLPTFLLFSSSISQIFLGHSRLVDSNHIHRPLQPSFIICYRDNSLRSWFLPILQALIQLLVHISSQNFHHLFILHNFALFSHERYFTHKHHNWF
jgi:hypothetical protein